MMLIPGPSVRSNDFYLPIAGPAPLRFAPTPADPRNFKWPAAVCGTNQNESAALSSSTPTNSTSSVLQRTNTVDLVAQSPAPTVPLDASFLGPDANPSSASNLLLLTPQMLSDFFRANFDHNAIGAFTNGFNGLELPFNPPTPKLAPSSEAIYRVQ
jgi:hypothetical protein